VNGRKVNIPSFQITQYDVIDVRGKSLEMTPFIVARETHGERVVPGWMEVLPQRMRILVHNLPVRAQIDIPVQEQLIVEYYSKK
jgi:small subunit ribosomal protein S4